MEQELNIAAILRDKPHDLKLYDVARDINVFYGCLVGDDCEIHCDLDEGGILAYNHNGTLVGFPKGMQILKPSKEMQDWSKFAWKKGDVLIDNKGYTCLFYKWKDDTYTSFIGKYAHFGDLNNRSIKLSTDDFHKIISNEKNDEIIKEVEAYYNGKLNLETLEVEKREPQFKDGDIVYIGNAWNEYICILKEIVGKYQILTYAQRHKDSKENTRIDGWLNKNLSDDFRLATDSEKQQLFDALAKENKRWNSETKVVEDLPKKCELKPKDWCLMRKGSIDTWHLCQYSDTCDEGYYGYYAVGGNFFKECIHYNEQTKHLLGTTDDYEEGGEK